MKSNVRLGKNKKGIECLNCEQPISNKDNFCSNCGQVNDLKPLSIKQYLTEFLSGFFSFDTRTINTILPLLFKPGKVTNEYIHGSRKQYVNPFQLYLHTSIIFFLVTGIFNSIDSYNKIANTYKTGEINNILNDSISKKVDKKLEKTSKELSKNKIDFGLLSISYSEKDSLETEKDKMLLNKTKKIIFEKSDSLFNSVKFNSIVKDTLKENVEKDKIIDTLITNKISNLYANLVSKKEDESDFIYNYQDFKMVYINNLDKNLRLNNIDYKISNHAKSPTEDPLISNSFFNKINKLKNCKTKNVGKALDSLGYKRTTINIFWFKKAKQLNLIEHDKDAQATYISNAISKIAIVLFFMLPIFALFMKLFYIRRKYNYTEHLIFIFHTQTVFFFLLLLAIIIERLFNTSVGIPIFILLFLVYLFITMLKFYKQSIWKTFFKFILLNITYNFLAIIGSVFVMFLAFLM